MACSSVRESERRSIFHKITIDGFRFVTLCLFEVRGDKARLYVNGVEQPTLLINDLKQGQSKGSVALWIGPGNACTLC
jgi:hypothetical protein